MKINKSSNPQYIRFFRHISQAALSYFQTHLIQKFTRFPRQTWFYVIHTSLPIHCIYKQYNYIEK